MKSFLSRFTILRESVDLGLKPGQVLLTFDDGPNLHHSTTERLLEVLLHHKVRASFCLIGEKVEQAPELTERIHQERHLIANHTQTHAPVLFQSERKLTMEARQCDQTLGAILGESEYRSTFYRTPGGVVTPAVQRMLDNEDRIMLCITDFAFDTLHGPATSDVVVRRTLQHAEANQGGVFVLHDGKHSRWRASPRKIHDRNSGDNRSWIPEAVDEILHEMKRMGLSILDPNDLLSFHP